MNSTTRDSHSDPAPTSPTVRGDRPVGSALPAETGAGSAPTFRLTTLGCRVNHAETRDLESILLSRGLARAERNAPADLEVIHTCAVTRSAAAKSRHAIRRAAWRSSERALIPQDNPRVPEVIVTGCFASSDPEVAAELAGNDGTALGHHGPEAPPLTERFASRIDQWLTGRPTAVVTTTPLVPASSGAGRVLALPVVVPENAAGRHIRAELQIQDGCDAHCTFCIIPSLRPALRSKRVEDARAEATRLVDLGHGEIVLTGIFLGAYGQETALRRHQDAPGAEQIADLVDAVASVPGLQRLRISSLEPGDITGPLLDALVAHAPVTVPHLHLPLQSGSNTILRRMNRQYDAGEYRDLISQVTEALTRDGLPPAITTDVICGFPGETDADFAATVAMVEHARFLHLHVFPFSPRPGTAAARWRDDFVPDQIIRDRVRHLIDMETDSPDGLSLRYRRQLLGRRIRVMVEQPDRAAPDQWTGRCDHYALIHLPGPQTRGTLIDAVVDEVTATHTRATPAETSIALPLLSS